MQTQFTPNNKLASLGTVGLLFLAGIAGMVFLLPASPAHAAGPTVTLSTLSSGVLTAVTSGTVGTTLVIEGFGFLPASPIAITTAVGTTTVPWLTPNAGCTTTMAYAGTSSASTPVDSLVSTATGCMTTTAVGNFAVEVNVPYLPGGAQSISITDGTNTATASFTVTPKVSISYTGNEFGFPEETVTPTITATGFASGESVSGSTTAFTAAQTSYACTAGSSVGTTLGSYGSCTLYGPTATTIADTSGGSKTFTATGATSGLTATATITVNPWAAFYNSNNEKTTFSFIGTAPTSLLVEAHGLPAATIAANSITVGGTATNHASVTVGASGAFYGLVVSPATNVPFGLVSAVIGGTTFNYASGNIAQSVNNAVGGANVWGGALISSIQGTSASTGVAVTDASSYKPGAVTTPSTTSPVPTQNQIAFFGYGFVPGGSGGGAVAIATPGGASFLSGPTFATGNAGGATGDANGAFFAVAALGDTPWSSVATPTVAASYTATVTQAATAPANVLSPSFGIAPWIDTTKGGIMVAPTAAGVCGATASSTTVDYTYCLQAKVHGFGPTDVVTITIGGTAMVSAGTTGPNANGGGTSALGQVPDLAGGKQNIVATGSITAAVVTATSAVTYDPVVNSIAGVPPTGVGALSINQGGAGQTTTLRTGTGYGVHGLLANDAYQIVWNSIGGSVTVGTFTASATGGIPVPGVQFTIPADSAGIHIIDIQNTGSYAIFGSLKLGQLTPGEDIPPSNFPNSGYTTGFGDMLFKSIGVLQAAPSVATIGSPESLSGSGLAAGTTYVVTLSSSSGTVVPNTSPALATFVATSSGSVPGTTSITLTDTPTTLETGSVEYLTVQTAAHYGVSPYAADAYAQFVLAASASLNMTSAPAGHPVTLTAHALNTGAVYAIVFNYVQSPFSVTSYTGTTVGVIAPNSLGAGTATFNVPLSAQTGAYPVDLVVTSAGPGGAPVGTGILDTPPSLTVGGTSGSCTNEGTACMGISGTPTVTKQGGNTIISATYTNNSNAPQTAFIYAVAHNALGQTVLYTTSNINPSAGGSATGQLVLFGLAPGTYSVSVFVVSSSGTALSTPTTVSVTI